MTRAIDAPLPSARGRPQDGDAGGAVLLEPLVEPGELGMLERLVDAREQGLERPD